MTIQCASAEDAHSIKQVKDAVWPTEATDEAYIRSVIAQPDHRTFYARVAGVPAGLIDGFLTLSAAGVRRWEVDLLAVHPEFRQQGIAARLIAASIDAGRELGAEQARALIHTDNTGSQKAFARCGFHQGEAIYTLFVSTNGAGDDRPAPETHLIPVTTLNYRGIWLEGVIDAPGLARAQAVRARYGWDVAGAVIPQTHKAEIAAAVGQGYVIAGPYAWWYLEL